MASEPQQQLHGTRLADKAVRRTVLSHLAVGHLQASACCYLRCPPKHASAFARLADVADCGRASEAKRRYLARGEAGAQSEQTGHATNLDLVESHPTFAMLDLPRQSAVYRHPDLAKTEAPSSMPKICFSQRLRTKCR